MQYRIIEFELLDGWGVLRVQYKRRWRWHTIWEREFAALDREYALLCAEELKEHLEAEL